MSVCVCVRVIIVLSAFNVAITGKVNFSNPLHISVAIFFFTVSAALDLECKWHATECGSTECVYEAKHSNHCEAAIFVFIAFGWATVWFDLICRSFDQICALLCYNNYHIEWRPFFVSMFVLWILLEMNLNAKHIQMCFSRHSYFFQN